eukprot:CAMPEP_0115887684 /NCGR_PEP_ID=MMETSP0287-20121206/31894_1 /TAXON_ID=412157 /ORGANISM="Chrysochromulina rotalis, Strain UIO044" /LENGTH=323 /DNA_ID=CAMNT_0003344295 /DNA_START=7 /DNA_END=978 /DNA_ORIENTATION=+
MSDMSTGVGADANHATEMSTSLVDAAVAPPASVTSASTRGEAASVMAAQGATDDQAEWSDEVLDAFLPALPAERATADDCDGWQQELLTMFNRDRRNSRMPLLLPFIPLQLTKQHLEPASAGAILDTDADAVGVPPPLLASQSSAWAIWQGSNEGDDQGGSQDAIEGAALAEPWPEGAAVSPTSEGEAASQKAGDRSEADTMISTVGPSVTAAGADTVAASGAAVGAPTDAAAAAAAEYEAFWQALPPQAHLVLQDLYDLGILSPHDAVSRQARFVKAINGAYDPTSVTTSCERTVKHGRGSMARADAHAARKDRRARNKAKC